MTEMEKMAQQQLVEKNIIMRFSSDVVDAPIVYHLVTKFQLVPNIIKANVNQDKEGYMILRLAGEQSGFDQAMEYLKGLKLHVQALTDHVSWNEKICTHCGACTAICPSAALFLRRPEMNLCFDAEKCVVCHMCIKACPVGAVKLDI